ncbi:MAG: TIGR01777 family oxidoreductase [Pyrinomonadaceae bacterium]
MKVLISGASGLLGGKLRKLLIDRGDEVFSLSRSEPATSNDIQWDPYKGFSSAEAEKLFGFDAVVHLAGENVAGGSWTEERKKKISDSRVLGTRTLVDALSNCKEPPAVFVCASAVGFYGDRGNEILTEESEPGNGFLPEVCVEWEEEAAKAKAFATRVVTPRIGIVLSTEGGALEKMLLPFKLGVGGAVGSGEQWMSWIAIDDMVRILEFALDTDELRDAFNAVAPNPVKNSEFSSALASELSRPSFFSVPAFGVKLLFGEMGETLLLEGCRVIPRKLEQMGFKFDFPTLPEALKHVLQD